MLRFQGIGRAVALAWTLGAAWTGSASAQAPPASLQPSGNGNAQPAPAPPVADNPGAAPVVAAPAPVLNALPGEVIAGPVLLLPANVQVVRFVGPPGVQVEILDPPPEPIVQPAFDDGLATFALRVGVGYRVRISNLPDRPGAEVFPVVEVVGHLHRPPGIDPLKYPIRIQLEDDDFTDVVARGQMVTKAIYLEDPETALPLSMPRGEIPVATLGPAEDPLQIAAALGRVMVVLRMGGRRPLPGEPAGMPLVGMVGGPCPFLGAEGGRCPMPCGPARGTPPPPDRAWMPRDEYLCDGGDYRSRAQVSGDGALRGIDPRDAVVRFRDDREARVLPTNVVCVYAPRFAGVRTVIGPNQTVRVENLRGNELVQAQEGFEDRRGPKGMTLATAAEVGRHRSRASSQVGRVSPGGHSEVRVLAEDIDVTTIRGTDQTFVPMLEQARQGQKLIERDQSLAGIKTAEGVVLEGIVEGARAQVMAWTPLELSQVEVPPDKPGMAVIKQVNRAEAEPGDLLTYTITYRNMGNIPVTAVSITDSLLPRLEYVPGSAKGPAGTVFTASENRVGSTELRWEIGTVAPGAQGAVQFQANVR